jgi:hypothetical protein
MSRASCFFLLFLFFWLEIPKPKDELGASERSHGCVRLWFYKTIRSFSSTKEMLRLLQLTLHVFVQTKHSYIDR